MDNRTSNKDDNKWVEESIARLSPPSGWRPDADQAFERLMQQRRKPASISPVLRLSLAGATIAAIAVVVTLLPWQTLWAPKPDDKTVATEKLVEPAQPAAQHVEAFTVPEPQQAPSTTEGSPAEKPKQGGTPSTEPTGPPSEKQSAPEAPPRPKKNPRPFASLQEQKSGPETAVAALQEAQGQNPPPPDTGVRPPTLLSKVAAEYTPEAREAKVTGEVEILVTVLVDGTVRFEKITKSLGYGLDEACADGVKRFKFRPAMKDGQPVAVSVSLLCNFSLR